FTLIAYLVDVYHHKYPVERDPLRLMAYVVFFPHLIAGPILRPHELLPQFDKFRQALSARFGLGALLFSMGMAKKLLVADQIAPLVETVYSQSAPLDAVAYLLAIYGFSAQIYCDFSGYTDMAIGLAIILGIRLPNNFNKPYISLSVAEFWRRWHLTLSRWLQSYIYIPLGGNRHGFLLQVRNIFITMVIGGLWHGANWTFLIWGVLHAFAIMATHFSRRRPGLHAAIGAIHPWILIFFTFHFVTFGWVFFRAPDMATAARVLAGPITAGFGGALDTLIANSYPLIAMAALALSHRFDEHSRLRLFVGRSPAYVVWPLVIFIFVISAVMSVGDTGKFIYFDF
ncbi:MAG: hypothetical protein OEV92_12135, partial [Nitrospinota bacterium]|nr:hypothetical protein [Nitrospinota bacterium]